MRDALCQLHLKLNSKQILNSGNENEMMMKLMIMIIIICKTTIIYNNNNYIRNNRQWTRSSGRLCDVLILLLLHCDIAIAAVFLLSMHSTYIFISHNIGHCANDMTQHTNVRTLPYSTSEARNHFVLEVIDHSRNDNNNNELSK